MSNANRLNRLCKVPFSLAAGLLLSAVSLASVAASCRFEDGRFTVLTGSYTPPVLESFTLTGENSAVLCFSRKVEFTLLEYARAAPGEENQVQFRAVQFGDTLNTAADSTDSPSDGAEVSASDSADPEKAYYRLIFPEPARIGSEYLLRGAVKDAGKNTLEFSLAFIGYNERVSAAVFSEAGPVHSLSSKNPEKAKAEFIELYILEDGNIGGMVIQSAHDGELADFVLPAAEVKAGDYLTVHLRVLGEKAVSETGTDLALSATVYSWPESRDIWNEKADNTKTRLGADDVLLLRERQGGKLIDALLYSPSDKSAWSKDLMNAYAREAFESGIWLGGTLPSCALRSDGVTAVRTLSRLNVRQIAARFAQGQRPPFTVSSADWKVLSGKNGEKASPGRPNVFAPAAGK